MAPPSTINAVLGRVGAGDWLTAISLMAVLLLWMRRAKLIFIFLALAVPQPTARGMYLHPSSRVLTFSAFHEQKDQGRHHRHGQSRHNELRRRAEEISAGGRDHCDVRQKPAAAQGFQGHSQNP